jgi:hypothetical protein
LETETVFYKKNNSSQKSLKVLKLKIYFFFYFEKLDIGLPKKAKQITYVSDSKNDSSQFETLTSIEINYLSQKNIWF